ncbi:MAG TPA: thiamine phosphate synthase [Allosphingosinicella sp.]|jgi:thiamine-phosphate pyrophosphorylase
MQRRQPLPRLWLMTDERQGEALWTAIERLPRGAGIVFRHYSLPPAERRKLFLAVKRRARRHHLTLILAGTSEEAASYGAEGFHRRQSARKPPGLIRTAPAHNLRELRSAERGGADLVFLSPAFDTRSHPDKGSLGPLRFMLLARRARVPVIALGGMNARRARRLGSAIYGWAGIDAWARQKRKAVPT